MKVRVPRRTIGTAAIVAGPLGSLLVGKSLAFGADTEPTPGQAVIAWTAHLNYIPGQSEPTIFSTDVGAWNVDVDGHALGERTRVPATLTATRAVRDAVACRTSGTLTKGTKVAAPYRFSFTTAYGTFSLAALFADARGAGAALGMRGNDQWDGCLAAGGTAATGYRLLQAGAGMAHADTLSTQRMGYDFAHGPAPATYTRGTNFPVLADTNSGLAGTVHQQPGGDLDGSLSAPVEVGEVNKYERNAAFAWWQDPCTDDGHCTTTAGSTAFQGATATAFWVLPTGQRAHYVITGFLRIACPGRCL
jgi:hypothetical protein